MAQLPVHQRRQQGRAMARREHPLQRLQSDFDTLLNRLWGGGWMTPYEEVGEPMRLWDFNVSENDKEIAVRAEVPGFEPNEVEVQLNNDVLTIKAEKQHKGEGEEEYRSFYRAISLPGGIDPDKVQATYRNGVLELHIPRAPEAQPRRIAIQGQHEQLTSGQAAPTTIEGKSQPAQQEKTSSAPDKK
jgi:HSP20 family protein